MEYRVHVIADNELTGDGSWAFVRTNGNLEFWLKESATKDKAALEMALEEGWAAYREINAERLMSWEPTAAVEPATTG